MDIPGADAVLNAEVEKTRRGRRPWHVQAVPRPVTIAWPCTSQAAALHHALTILSRLIVLFRVKCGSVRARRGRCQGPLYADLPSFGMAKTTVRRWQMLAGYFYPRGDIVLGASSFCAGK